MSRVFIPALAGAQSTAIAEALRSAGWDVDGSSRSDRDDAQRRAAGADLLVLTIPQDHRPGAMTQFIDRWVEVAREGDVGRIILNTGGAPGAADEHPFFADIHTAQDRVIASGLPFVILQPTVYLDNLAAPWAAEALAAGTIAYPAAPDAEVSWLSHRTLGTWVASVAKGAADGRTIAIGGPESLTGADLARAIGDGLGRSLSYAPIPPADFAQGMNAAMGAPAGDRIAAIYVRLAAQPTSMRVDPAPAIELSVPLEAAHDFAARVLAR